MNIYDGCLKCSDVFYREYGTSWDAQLDKKKEYYEKQGYKVVFVVEINSFQDAARVVIYDEKMQIPKCMQNYKYKYVRFDGHWVDESLLGICDKCGNYNELTYLCDEGELCRKCKRDTN